MHTRSAALLVVLFAPLPARAAVIVLGNYSADPITCTLTEPGAKARELKLPPNHVISVAVTGPADLTFTPKDKPATLRLDPYNAYLFIPDDKARVRLEGLELPGAALERDARPELNPIPRDPVVKIPVTLYVDDADPRADWLWQKELRARFNEAAAALERGTGVRLELAGFDTWKSDPAAKNTSDLLKNFETEVRVKPGTLAVGYTSRRIDEKQDPAFGASRGLAGRHVLVRESRPRNEPERSEVLLHFLAEALGAVGSPDPNSAMRAKLGDGYTLHARSVLRLDPLNALALTLWGEERRREPGVEFNGLTATNRHRLTRVYKALVKAAPGDVLALGYLNELDRDVAKEVVPMARNPARPPVKVGPRDELARQIVRAVAERARRNTGPEALTGDDLTAAYVRAAAQAAVKHESPEMVPAFLIALGLALDDTNTLTDDATTAAAVRDIEPPEERTARLAALGNPTLAGRRDLCRRFFVGCAAGELLAPDAAERAAVGRALFDLHKPAGLCVPVLAAEFAGIAFARTAQNDAELLRDVIPKFAAADYLPKPTGLRNGLGPEKFEELYGDANDDRFLALLADVRNRLKGMRAYK
jgi:hypothetical protein